MTKLYDYTGRELDIGGSVVDYDTYIKSVCHRGYDTQGSNPMCPENTLPAYVVARSRGFNYVETDISFTSDGVAVLLHDASINRTARNMDGSQISGTVNINSITYEQALGYDFGIYAGAEWAGTPIPTVTQFLDLCKALTLKPYLELKDNGNYTQSQINGIIDNVQNHSMIKDVTFISFSSTYLEWVVSYNSSIRVGFLKSASTASDISVCNSLKTTNNEVFYDTKYSNVTDAICQSYATANIPIEIWTVDSEDYISSMNRYISGVTSNKIIAGKALYDEVMGVG